LVELQVEVKRMQLTRLKEREQDYRAKRDAGAMHVAEVVSLLKQYEAATALMNDEKVRDLAGWAATVSRSSASSVARSASAVSEKTVSSLPSVESVASSASALALKKLPLVAMERAMVKVGVREADVRAARKKAGRALRVEDLVEPGFPVRLTVGQRADVAAAAVGAPMDCDSGPVYHCYD
jgi:hypothetical protein